MIVSYANDPAVCDLITATWAELVPCTSVLPVADNNWPDDPIAVMRLFFDNAVQSLPQLRAAYEARTARSALLAGGGPGRPAWLWCSAVAARS